MLNKGFQIILLNKNNFHQHQPLLYQVATAGLEPSAISFPLRKIIQRECNVHFRVAEILEISGHSKEIRTNIGDLKYDYLVLAMGTNPNFFGHASIGENTLPMKSAAGVRVNSLSGLSNESWGRANRMMIDRITVNC
jgi:NADH dehydrogenase